MDEKITLLANSACELERRSETSLNSLGQESKKLALSKAKRKYTADEVSSRIVTGNQRIELVTPDAIFDQKDDLQSAPGSPIKIRQRDLDLLHLSSRFNEFTIPSGNRHSDVHGCESKKVEKKKKVTKSPSFNTNGFLLGQCELGNQDPIQEHNYPENASSPCLKKNYFGTIEETFLVESEAYSARGDLLLLGRKISEVYSKKSIPS